MLAVFLTSAAVLARSVSAQSVAEPPTVDSLWQGIDVRSLPLEFENLQEWREQGTVTRKVMYTSHFHEGYRVRIIGYYAFPAGGQKLPGLLHIHGGGQTANREYVELFARQGCAALSINWGGNPLENGQGNSDWGPAQVDQSDNERVFQMRPNFTANPWFRWAIACRRALTVLEQQTEVDPSALGVFGISMGGRLTWLVAGTDERVKAAVSIYGAVKMADPIAGIPGSEQMPFAPGDAELWRKTLDAAAYAPRIRCPFFFLSAADDFYGSMDRVDHVLATIPNPNHRQSFTPHFNHHVEPAQSASLLLWMGRWLQGGPAWPNTPGLTLAAVEEDGVPTAAVVPDRTDDVLKVQIYYSSDPYPQSRFWRSAEILEHEGQWTGHLPLTRLDPGLFAYANVLYRSGVSLSTRLFSITGERLRELGAKPNDPPSETIDGFENGPVDWFVPEVGVNPLLQERLWFVALPGPGERPAITCHEHTGGIWRLATRKIGDPKWNGGKDGVLAFQACAAEPNTIIVIATEDERRRPYKTRSYVAVARLDGGKWEPVVLPLASFHDVDSGAVLTSWEHVNLLGIQGQYVRRAGKSVSAKTVGEAWQGPPAALADLKWLRSDARPAAPGADRP